MLSAIAARKAAQAALLSAQTTLPTPNKNLRREDQYSGDTSEETTKTSRPTESKRKPSVDQIDRQKKKRRKKHQNQSQSRYFSAETRGDIIVVEDDEERDDQSSSSSESDEGAAVVKQVDPPLRAWSPSQAPLVLSETSGDEDDHFVEGNSGYDLEGLVPAPLDNGYPTNQVLTFNPTLNQNTFYFSESEAEHLLGRKGTIVSLSPGETLGLQGVYSITVLRGTISVLGSNLLPSTTSHQIFSPKCSPLPIIKAISDCPSGNLPENYVKRISSASAVVLLEDLITGVEGLGKICKTFENTFGDGHLISDILGLSTARLVSQ